MTDREIMQQALDALKLHLTHHEHGCVYLNPVMYALEAALAQPKREWVGLTDDEIKGILDCGRGGVVDIKKAEQILKEKNGG